MRSLFQTTLPPGREDQLLVACARTSLTPDLQADVRSLCAAGVDWRYLFAHADRHHIVPLLHLNLAATCPDLVPPAAAEALHARAQEIAQRNLLLTMELLRVLRLCEQHGVTALPFKGPALASLVYGQVALRQFDDLDLWIRERDFWRLREILMAENYEPFLPPSDEQLRSRYTERHHEYGFMRTDGGVHLEVCWRVIQRPFAFPRDVEQWWDTMQPVSLLGRTTLALPPERLLLCLCVHGSKHLWERLIWVCDVAETIRATPNLNWTQLTHMARSMGAERMLLLGLTLASRLLGADVPDALLRKSAADAELGRLVQTAHELLFRTGEYPEEIYRTRHLFQMRMLERFPDRARVVLNYSYNLLRPRHVYEKYGLAPLKHLLKR